jgi:hypothetical protein
MKRNDRKVLVARAPLCCIDDLKTVSKSAPILNNLLGRAKQTNQTPGRVVGHRPGTDREVLRSSWR